MATITTDTHLDGGAVTRTAGEAWTVNSGAKLTVKTDTRWHIKAPALLSGSLGAITINEGEVIFDSRNIRWLSYINGTGTVPNISASITQSAGSGVSGSYLLGVYASLASAPSTPGAVMPSSGFIKFREVTGSFVTGSLTGSEMAIEATNSDVAGWMEVVCDSAAGITVARLGKHTIRGDWFYLDNTSGVVGQTIQLPTNGGGIDTHCPGIWIETSTGSDSYEYWPALSGSTCGWSRQDLGAPSGSTDQRQNFVKTIGSGQIQIGEASDLSGSYTSVPAQSGTYASIAQSSTYTWVGDVVTITFTTGHLLKTGQQTHLDFTTGGATGNDGIYTITVVDAYTYTVSLAGSGAAGNVTSRPGFTITFTANTLGVGDTVYYNFTSGGGTNGEYSIYAVTSANVYLISAPHASTISGNATAFSRYSIAYDRHGLVNGNRVYLDFTSGGGVSGVYTIVWPALTSQAAAYTWAGGVVTVTFTAHGHLVGDTVYLDFTSGGGTPDGNYVVASVTSTSVFTVALAGSGTAGNVTIYPSYFHIVANNGVVIESGNVVIRQIIGNIPIAGCKTRIPNVILRECATAARQLNKVPHATIGSRPEFATTTAGAIDFEYVYSNWYHNINQAFSVIHKYFSTFDTLVITECADTLTIDDGGISMYGGLDVRAIQLTSNFAGGTISNTKAMRAHIGTTDHAVEVLYCKGQTFSNFQAGILRYPRSTGKALQLNYSSDLTFNNCRIYNSDLNTVATFDTTINDLDVCDRFIGFTNATTPYYAVNINTKCNNVLVDGVTFGFNGAIPNVHSVSGLFYCIASDNIRFRNAGSHASPLSGGSWRPNFYALAYVYATGGNNNTVKVQRCYVDLFRTGLILTLNSDKNVLYESVFGGHYVESACAIFLQIDAGLNSILKAYKTGANTVAGQASVYGTHFRDMFLGSSFGRFILSMNEPTAETLTQFTMVSGVAKFNSSGGILMGTIGNQAIWEDTCFRLGHTGFTNTSPTMSGGTIGNYTVEYQIDTGSGYGGSWKTANGTNLSGETISPITGFKMKIRITTTSTNTTAITYLRFNTTTTLSDQESNLYPLDTVDTSLNIINLQSGSEIRVYRHSDDYALAGIEDSSLSFSYNYTWTGTDTSVYIRIMSYQYQWLTYVSQSLGSEGLTIPVVQQYDRQYLNPA